MHLLDVEPLDLGPDVRAVGLELTEADENREPVRGIDAARVWSRVLRATAANEIWALDFSAILIACVNIATSIKLNIAKPVNAPS